MPVLTGKFSQNGLGKFSQESRGNASSGGNTGEIFVVDAATFSNNPMTYDNGVDGVGATLTSMNPGIYVVDGKDVEAGKRYQFKNQSSSFQNGIYICSVVGSLTPIAVRAVFTRATDYDTPEKINVGDLIAVTAGNTQAGTAWIQTAVVNEVGVDPILFSQSTANLVVLTGDVEGAGVGTVATTLVKYIVRTWDGSDGPVDVTAGSNIDITGGVISSIGGVSTVPVLFSAELSGALLNSTGDGTLVDVICDNVISNISNSYNPLTGVFTAPYSGQYLFITDVFLSNLGSGHTQYLNILLTSNDSYMMSQGNSANERSGGSNQLTRRGAALVYLNAGEQALLQAEVSGSTKTVTIGAGTQPTSFSGYLVGTTTGEIVPPGDSFLPTVTVLSGGDLVDSISGKYSATSASSGGIVTGVARFSFTSDGSQPLVTFSLTPPLVASFEDSEDAEALGAGKIIKTVGGAGQTGQGTLVDLYADVGTGDMRGTIETAQNGVSYTASVPFIYKIQ